MVFDRFSRVALCLGLFGTALGSLRAGEQIGKPEAIAALDEPCYDDARFERIAMRAKSLGVSDSRIVLSRLGRALAKVDLEALKRMLPEAESAFATLPASEVDADILKIRDVIPNLKKLLSGPDSKRFATALEKNQHESDAKSILADLRKIDLAVDQCALMQRLGLGAVVPASEWQKYLKPGSRLRETGADLFGATYGDQIAGTPPKPNPSSLAKVSAYVPQGYFDLTEPKRQR